jgi:hypothetical protein
MAITLKPFRQYDEHDVINMFTYDVDATVTSGVQASAGTIVGLTSGGWKAGEDIHDLTATQPNAAVNNNGYGNTLSLRYNLLAEVVAFAGTTDDGLTVPQPLGMLLHDVRTLDENGEDLRYNPRKADEMQVVVPGQAVPIVTRGIFLLGATGSEASDLDDATAGERLTATAGGLISVAGDANDYVIGKALGDWDATTSTVLVMLDI